MRFLSDEQLQEPDGQQGGEDNELVVDPLLVWRSAVDLEMRRAEAGASQKRCQMAWIG